MAALRAFEAAARTLSFSEAGREMNVSHAAVAQNVRRLEDELGRALIVRAGRGLALTADGAALSRGLTEGFGAIRAALDAFRAEDAARPLRVTMTPNFAVGFLIPRLGGFRAAHPEIELDLDPSARTVDLGPGGPDLAIRYGDGDWPGLETRLLIAAPKVIVAAPSLVAGREVREPADLLSLPWLQEQGTEEIRDWLASEGVTGPHLAGGAAMPGYMLYPALLEGQGIALAGKVFVEDDIAAGRLVRLFEDDDLGGRLGYHLARRPGPARPALAAFIRWLRREAARAGEAMSLVGRV
ncbi:MAG: LysR family transcriptional regulator [Pseudomonadota bacterium]|nr:LysR family transcriptional regulator [Pseudomonadota bacterium]